MPSGGITITPGYQLAPGEKVNNAKLNQGFQPVGQVNEGAITGRELDQGIVSAISSLKNLLCNGGFQIWYNENYTALQTSGLTHEYGATARWAIANDANRAVTRQQFSTGSTDVPSGVNFLRWIQSASVSRNPAYLGQRIEDVRRFGGRTVAFSVYVRANGNLIVTPKVRQVFGGVKRFIQNTVSASGGGGVIIDGAATFRASDVGGAITVFGPAFTTVNSTITAVNTPANIVIAASIVSPASGLTAFVTSPAGSTEVVTAGAPLSLVADTWTRLTQVFAVPDVSGKTIPNAILGSFTEFRIDVPQGATFQIDFANAQLEFSSAVTDYQGRLLHEDMAYARFYQETKMMNLSNAITVWKPFISLDPKSSRPVLALTPSSGTGGNVALDFAADNFVNQTINHSAIVTALVMADAEIRD